MELEQLVRLLTRTDGEQRREADLTLAVRDGLVAAIAGNLPPGLTAEEALSLQRWLHQEGGRADDPVSALYQRLLRTTLYTGAAGELHLQHQSKAHRATGAYYTCHEVVAYMLGRSRRYQPDAEAVIDPACGPGALLKGALETYGAGCVRLSGLDADPVALALCHHSLPSADLHQLDALLDPFPGGFDLCLANPPYISSGLRGAPVQTGERSMQLRARFPHTAEYKLNTYPLFIERGFELLREGGLLAYIVPDSFLTGRYFAGLRRLLLSHTLLELTLIQEDFWQHGRVGQSVILFARKGEAPSGHKVRIRLCDKLASLSQSPKLSVSIQELVWGPLHRFRLIQDNGLRERIHQMEKIPGGRQLGDLIRSYSGLIGRKGQASLLRATDSNAHSNPSDCGQWGRLLRSGKEIDRYRLCWAGAEVCLDPRLIKSGGHLPYYQQPKILLRQTAESIRAVYDDQGHYCLNNIHLLLPRLRTVNLRALLGLLNASPVNRWYRGLTMETGRLYAQVDLDLLESLPIPPISPTDTVQLERAVCEREKAAPEEAAKWERTIDRLVTKLYGLDR